MKCINCRFWKKNVEIYPNSIKKWIGTCKILPEQQEMLWVQDSKFYINDYNGLGQLEIYTREDFGCSLFERKE